MNISEDAINFILEDKEGYEEQLGREELGSKSNWKNIKTSKRF